MLSQWNPPLEQQIQRYRRFVEEGLLREVKSPYAQAAAQSLVGSESFVERIKREFLSKRDADRREEPSLVRLQESVSLDLVVSAVGDAYDVEPDRLLRRAGSHGEARRLAMYLASLHCRGGSSLTALADAFGLSLSGLTRARGRMEEQLRRDSRLRALAEEIGRCVKSSA